MYFFLNIFILYWIIVNLQHCVNFKWTAKWFTKNIGAGCHAFLQGILLTQGSNLRLLSPALAGGFFTTSATWETSFIHIRTGEGNGTPLWYSCLENPMDRGAWWAAVHGVAKSRTWLSDFTFTFHFHALEKEMATHSSVLAWRTPGMGEPGGLSFMGSHRIRHDWCNLAAVAAHTYISSFSNSFLL